MRSCLSSLLTGTATALFVFTESLPALLLFNFQLAVGLRPPDLHVDHMTHGVSMAAHVLIRRVNGSASASWSSYLSVRVASVC